MAKSRRERASRRGSEPRCKLKRYRGKAGVSSEASVEHKCCLPSIDVSQHGEVLGVKREVDELSRRRNRRASLGSALYPSIRLCENEPRSRGFAEENVLVPEVGGGGDEV